VPQQSSELVQLVSPMFLQEAPPEAQWPVASQLKSSQHSPE